MKIGGFTQGATQAERQAGRTARELSKRKKEIEKEWSTLGTAIAAGFAGITIGSTFGKFIQESKDAQAEQAQLVAVLKSTKEAAGYSAEELNEMASAMAGVFSDGDINRAQTRLLAYTNVVGNEFPEALQAAVDMAARMGMTVEQAAETVGKALNVPSEGMSALKKQGFSFTEQQVKLAQRLQETGRTAEAQAIVLAELKSSYGGAAEAARNTFGGAISELQHSLNSLMTGDDGSLQGATESIQDLTKQMNSSETKQAFAALTAGLASVISFLASATTHVINFSRFVGEALGSMAHGSADPIERLNEQIASLETGLVTAQRALKTTDPRAEGFREYGKYVEETTAKLEQLRKMRAGLVADANRPAASAGPVKDRPKPPRIPTKGDGSDDPTKALLANQLKEFDRLVQEQTGIMADRNRMLDLYNGQGLVSVQGFYDAQRAILEEATAGQVKAYDAQIAALEKYRNAAEKKTDRADAEGKIAELVAKRAKVQQDAGLAAIELDVKQQQAAKELADSLQDVNVRLMELRGQTAEAAALNFDKANEGLKKLFQANGNQQGLDTLAKLKESTVAQAQLNELTQRFSLIQGDLGDAEKRIALDREAGTISEMEALQRTGAARRERIGLLQQEIDKFVQLQAVAVLTPEQQQAFNRLKLQMEELNASIDPLGDKLRSTFEGSFSNLFSDIADRSKTAKDAVKDFGKSVLNEFNNLISKQLGQQMVNSLFGAKGSSGGAAGGGWGSLVTGFMSLFGFVDGGYTGAGGKYQPAGIVHRGEGVLNQGDMAKIGGPAGFAQLVSTIRSGRSHASGGVGGSSSVPFSPAANGPSTVVNVHVPAGSTVEQKTRRGSGGQEIVDVFVNQAAIAVAGQIAGNYGPVGQAMQARSRRGM
ncbi:phage tail length tape measure family protein [Pseudorhodoferax sp. Leaf274]|uniref:phage tail length tape measure family protein n=1 Tax=Pseudorhodoferax sp. Leaf274 TaxID=1736318 RepID=UPI000703651A|nr:phage tail length tape measure family protein [Pseudorhodoferax sp. Leaf274]KQP37554.1 hypothetical protein ASF44_14505 [Pseudorhodoferax sp. Leaf274]